MKTLQALAVAGVAAACTAAGIGGVALGLSTAFARGVVTLDRGLERPVVVRRVIPGEHTYVWVTGEGAAAPGQYSLLFDAPGETPGGGTGALPHGHVRLGPVLRRAGEEVLREVVGEHRGTLAAGSRGRLVGWWYDDPADLGYRMEAITYDTELGPMDAWIVHPKWPRKKRWAIHVHGRGAEPAETLRGVGPVARAGVTSLIITYRNDRGQPAGHNERYGMGVAESRDVEAAIATARARGAERVTLMGWSMGGTASLVAAARGQHRDVIDGVVLESPGADWPDILRAQAAARRLPRRIADWGMGLIARGLVRSGEPKGINFGQLTAPELVRDIDVPVLVLASPADRFVPWHGSVALAEARPDIVQLITIPGAGHVRLWNVDPERWESGLLEFVAALPRPGWRGQ